MDSGRAYRVAFAAGDWLHWLGGLNYYRNLLTAVVEDPESTIEPVLFLGRDAAALEGFPAMGEVRSRLFDRRSPAWLARGIARRAAARDPGFERLLKRHAVVALSHSSQLWRSRQASMLGWIPDFQHLRLPEFFSDSERATRDRVFAQICSLSTLVIVSSEACRSDLVAFVPEHADKARVLRFVSAAAPSAALPSASELTQLYGVGERYFHIPNQFWAHKNHAVVIEALGRLRDQGLRPVVVATGETNDSRRPGHFEALMRRAQELQVDDQFLALGVVPYPHMAGLMRSALAVINPSRCEGWSTSVEEAKSAGKRVLLSDIDVHREQDPPGGAFFDPDDPVALAAELGPIWESGEPVDEAMEGAAGRQLAERRLQFSRTYEQIVAEAVSLHSEAAG